MRRRRGARTVVAIAGAVFGVGSAGFAGLAPAPIAHAAGPLTLISQTFNLDVDGTFRFVIELPPDIGSLPAATLVVTAHRAVASREAVADAANGTLPRSADSVDLPLTQLPRTAPNTVQGVVPLESATRTPEKLQLPAPGLYPIAFEIRHDGEVVAELVTFVHQVAAPAATGPVPAEVRVGLAMQAVTPVRLDGAGQVVIDDAVITELNHLAEALEAIAATNVPATVSVPPAWLPALILDEQTDLVNRLTASLARHELLSEPRLPLDASEAADAQLHAVYTEWLRAGDDILATTLAKPTVRTITFVDSEIDQAGAALHRSLGSRLLVMTADHYDVLPGSYGIFTDTSRLVTIEVAEGIRMDAALPDRRASSLLATSTDYPAHTAVLLVADLLAARLEMIDDDVDPGRRGITLAMPDLSVPPTTTLAAVASLLAATPGLRATTLDELGVRTDRLTDDGDVVVVGLPTTVTSTLGQRLAPVSGLASEATATASMLPADDPRLGEWTDMLARLPTNAFTDAQVTLILADLQKQFAAIRNSVEVPQGFSFTLTGRRTTVPIKLHNVSDTPLTVRVRMTSSKLLFPDGDQVVTLPPQSFFDVEMPIEVRSNGRFPVTLEVFTANGAIRLGPAVPLRARVNAIGGIANLITGALLLVVITWWFRHMRRKQRRRAAQKASLNHPVRGMADDDAARTSLPEL